jgi:hypothetical protein
MHDCNPVSFEASTPNRTTIAWNGDTYKAFIDFKENNPEYQCCVVDTDFGIGIIRQNTIPVNSFNRLPLDWNQFDKNRKQFLNLINWDEFKATY